METLILFIVEIISNITICIGRAMYQLKLWFVPKTWSEKHGFPTIRGIRFIGPLYQFLKIKWNIKNLPTTVYFLQSLSGLVQMFKNEKFLCFEAGPWKTFIIFDANIVQELLKCNKYLKKSKLYETLECRYGLTTSDVPIWKRHRKMLQPCFKKSLIDEHQNQVYEHSQTLIKFMKKEEGEVKDLQRIISSFTSRVICGFAFNYKLSDDEETVIQDHTEEYMGNAIMRFTRPWLLPSIIFRNSKLGKRFYYTKGMIDAVVKQIVSYKSSEILEAEKDSDENEKSVLGTLLTQRKQNRISKDEVTDEVFTFLIAGEDTSAYSITMCLFLLGHHAEIQQRLNQELIDVLGDSYDREITTNDINDLKFLTCVIKEARRIYTPLQLISRELEEDFRIGDKIFQKGSDCIIFIGGLHKHPEYFKDPEVFNPDRFTLKQEDLCHPTAYIPFSDGPRNCIGYKFAEMEEAIAIANIVRHFKIVSLEHRDKIAIVPSIASQTTKPIRIKLVTRKTEQK